MALCPDGHQSDATDYCDVCGLAIGAVSAPAARPAAGGMTASSRPGDPCPNCLLPREQGDPFCEGCGFDFAHETGYPTASTPRAPFDLDAELRKAEEEAARFAGSGAPVPPVSTPVSSVSAPVSTPLSTPLSTPVSGGSGLPGGGTSATAHVGSGTGSAGFGTAGGATASVTAPPSAGQAAPAAARWVLIANADRGYYDSVVAEGEIDPVNYPFPPYCPERRFTVSGDTLRIGRSSATRGSVEIDLTGPPTDPGVSHLHAVLQARPDGGWTVLDPGSTNGTVLNDDTAPLPPNQAIPVEPGFRIHVGVWTTLTLVRES